MNSCLIEFKYSLCSQMVGWHTLISSLDQKLFSQALLAESWATLSPQLNIKETIGESRTLRTSNLSLDSIWAAQAPMSPAITSSMSTYSKLKYLESVFKHLN